MGGMVPANVCASKFAARIADVVELVPSVVSVVSEVLEHYWLV